MSLCFKCKKESCVCYYNWCQEQRFKRELEELKYQEKLRRKFEEWKKNHPK